MHKAAAQSLCESLFSFFAEVKTVTITVCYTELASQQPGVFEGWRGER